MLAEWPPRRRLGNTSLSVQVGSDPKPSKSPAQLPSVTSTSTPPPSNTPSTAAESSYFADDDSKRGNTPPFDSTPAGTESTLAETARSSESLTMADIDVVDEDSDDPQDSDRPSAALPRISNASDAMRSSLQSRGRAFASDDPLAREKARLREQEALLIREISNLREEQRRYEDVIRGDSRRLATLRSSSISKGVASRSPGGGGRKLPSIVDDARPPTAKTAAVRYYFKVRGSSLF
jgi:hypothetical protein